MSEKRFELRQNSDGAWWLFNNENDRCLIISKNFASLSDICIILNELARENEQLRQELKEYKENWDDMVELATKTSRRNVELDEQIGQLQKELNDCEKFRYSIFKRIGELTDEL